MLPGPSPDCARLRQTPLDCVRLRQTASDCFRLLQTASDCFRLRQTGAHWSTLEQTGADCGTPDHQVWGPLPAALRGSVARFCEKVAPPFCGSNPQMRGVALLERSVITGCEHRNMRNIKFFAARRSSSRPRAERPTQSSRRKPRRAGFSE